MAGHEIYIFLSVFIHAPTFWDDITYIFMILFKPPLLVGNIRIAVKHISSVCAGFVFLDFPGILKFRAVICENNRKVFLKGPDSNGLTKVIDRLDDAFLCTVRE